MLNGLTVGKGTARVLKVISGNTLPKVPESKREKDLNRSLKDLDQAEALWRKKGTMAKTTLRGWALLHTVVKRHNRRLAELNTSPVHEKAPLENQFLRIVEALRTQLQQELANI